MRRTYLGEFEEMVLLMVAILDGEGYGVTVSQALEEHTGRIVTFGTVHNTLIRLEEKGFVKSELGVLQPNEVADASGFFGSRHWVAALCRKSSNCVRSFGNWFHPMHFD